jgi:hypothetical protein
MKACLPLCRRDYKPTSCIWNEYGLPLPLRQRACPQSSVIAIMWRLAASLAMALDQVCRHQAGVILAIPPDIS